MSTSTECLFRNATERVFSSWTALQLAVEHGMGGSDGPAKARNLIESVVSLFKSNPSLDWQDVADLLTDLMDDEFDTVCEDDSCDEVGFLLWELYKQCVAGDIASVEAEIAKLPCAGNWLSKSREVPPKAQVYSNNEETNNDSVQDSNSEDNMDVDTVDSDPGWTKVSRKNR